MTCGDCILRDYFCRRRAVKNYVIVITVYFRFFKPSANQGSLIPFRMNRITVMGSCEINLNIIQLEACRNQVQLVILSGIRNLFYRLMLNYSFIWKWAGLPNERFKNLINRTFRLHNSGPFRRCQANNREAALVIHVDQKNTCIVETSEARTELKGESRLSDATLKIYNTDSLCHYYPIMSFVEKLFTIAYDVELADVNIGRSKPRPYIQNLNPQSFNSFQSVIATVPAPLTIRTCGRNPRRKLAP